MAFIDLCKSDSMSPLTEAVCLSKEECNVLLPIISREKKKAAEKVEYYESCLEDGYGTELQSNKLIQWEEKLEKFERLESMMHILLNK